jgi:hypothetical protein
MILTSVILLLVLGVAEAVKNAKHGVNLEDLMQIGTTRANILSRLDSDSLNAISETSKALYRFRKEESDALKWAMRTQLAKLEKECSLSSIRTLIEIMLNSEYYQDEELDKPKIYPFLRNVKCFTNLLALCTIDNDRKYLKGEIFVKQGETILHNSEIVVQRLTDLSKRCPVHYAVSNSFGIIMLEQEQYAEFAASIKSLSIMEVSGKHSYTFEHDVLVPRLASLEWLNLQARSTHVRKLLPKMLPEKLRSIHFGPSASTEYAEKALNDTIKISPELKEYRGPISHKVLNLLPSGLQSLLIADDILFDSYFETKGSGKVHMFTKFNALETMELEISFYEQKLYRELLLNVPNTIRKLKISGAVLMPERIFSRLNSLEYLICKSCKDDILAFKSLQVGIQHLEFQGESSVSGLLSNNPNVLKNFKELKAITFRNYIPSPLIFGNFLLAMPEIVHEFNLIGCYSDTGYGFSTINEGTSSTNLNVRTVRFVGNRFGNQHIVNELASFLRKCPKLRDFKYYSNSLVTDHKTLTESVPRQYVKVLE